MLDSSRVFHLLKFTVPILILVWYVGYLSSTTSSREVLRKFKNEKELFVTDFLDNEIDGRFVGLGIAELCASKKWTPGLILTCDPPAGGIGSVKNGLLNCIRFAVEMGAELVLPRITRRNEEDITILRPDYHAPINGDFLDYFFDYPHLEHTLSTFCPQMKVYKSMDDLYNVPSVLNAKNIGLEDMGIALRNGSVIDDIKLLPSQIKKYMDEVSPPEKRRYPIRFNLPVTLFAWPTAAEEPSVALNWGRILQFREDTRRLAASALFNLEKRFHMSIDPRNGIKTESFVGIHLRTEEDAGDEFPEYETQAAYYLDYIEESKSPVVFLATGASQENITAFSDRARDFNVTVVLKTDILEDEDLDSFIRLTWDQRALVDYEIMLRAGLVAGTSQSSFAWNMALRRRNVYSSVDTPDQTLPGSHVSWQDKYSTIFGSSEKGWAMRQTIWP